MKDEAVSVPASLKGALTELAGGRVVPLAGGTDLLVRLHDCIEEPWPRLLVLERLKTLKKISTAGRRVTLGPLVTFSAVERSAVLRRVAPQLVQAASVASSTQIRSRATVGGNLANASPAGELIPPLFVLSARIVISSLRGRRSVAIDDFFKGPGLTVLKRSELITAVQFESSRGHGFYLRLAARRAMAISKVSVAADLAIRRGRVSAIKIALGAVAPTVIRAPQTEDFLCGRVLDGDSIARASELVMAEARPIDDIRSLADYRRAMVGVLLRRGLYGILEGRVGK
ncbi:MAG: xanthine dehydrogenase family protein subunit M [Candidatus Eisenbacteria bacterium]